MLNPDDFPYLRLKALKRHRFSFDCTGIFASPTCEIESLISWCRGKLPFLSPLLTAAEKDLILLFLSITLLSQEQTCVRMRTMAATAPARMAPSQRFGPLKEQDGWRISQSVLC